MLAFSILPWTTLLSSLWLAWAGCCIKLHCCTKTCSTKMMRRLEDKKNLLHFILTENLSIHQSSFYHHQLDHGSHGHCNHQHNWKTNNAWYCVVRMYCTQRLCYAYIIANSITLYGFLLLLLIYILPSASFLPVHEIIMKSKKYGFFHFSTFPFLHTVSSFNFSFCCFKS